MLVLQVDCGDMRNFNNFGIVGKAGKVSNAGAVGDMRIADNFGIVGKTGKISNTGAVGRLWQHEKC